MTRDLSTLLQTMAKSEQQRAAEPPKTVTTNVASAARIQSLPKPKGARVKFSPPESGRKS